MSNIITLSQAERDKFASWLEQDAEMSRGIIRKMEELPGSELLTGRFKLELAAFLVVAAKLRSIEEMTIEA